jgi:iduronate 2-sulfatase
VRYPRKVPRGRVCEEIVESLDIFPTFCELAGIEIPNHVQGCSVIPLLSETPSPIRDSALTENPYRKALATKRWRFVANIDGQEDELYDQVGDPWELSNRIHDADCAPVVQQTQRHLLDRLAHARRPINTINGFWHNHKYDRDGRIDLAASGGRNAYW